MKFFIAFALMIVGSCALPQELKKGLLTSNERLVTDSIASAIQDVSQSIKDAGLDPLYIPEERADIALPVPVLFSLSGEVEEFLLKGLSNIVITRLSFGTLTLRLRLDLHLPLIEANLNKADLAVIFFGEQINAAAAGRFAIRDIVVETDIRLRLGIISGISVSSVDASFKLGRIESNLAVSALGSDLSPPLNQFLGATVPNTLINFERDINQLLEIVLFDLINDNL